MDVQKPVVTLTLQQNIPLKQCVLLLLLLLLSA
jgi:hypothetical protein